MLGMSTNRERLEAANARLRERLETQRVLIEEQHQTIELLADMLREMAGGSIMRNSA